MRRPSITAVSVLQANANGFEYGFDVIDATGLPSATVYPARRYRITAAGVRALAGAGDYYQKLAGLSRAKA